MIRLGKHSSARILIHLAWHGNKFGEHGSRLGYRSWLLRSIKLMRRVEQSIQGGATVARKI